MAAPPGATLPSTPPPPAKVATNGSGSSPLPLEAAAPRPAPAPSSRPAESAPRDTTPGVRFTKANEPIEVPVLVASGWQAFQDGDFARASRDYQQHLVKDPQNRDALLGLAAIATRQARPDEARRRYQQLLSFNARDPVALAALATLGSDENPELAERRLRQMFADDPGPATALALGNLYARQGRWNEAQQYYFRAYSSAPQVADHAYNLATSLDHLGQSTIAADYYSRALTLGGNASFDRKAVQRRIGEIREP